MLQAGLTQDAVFGDIPACDSHKELFWDDRLAFDPRHPYEDTATGTRRLTNREVEQKVAERNELEQKALSVCHACPNLAACRQFSLTEEVFGVSGGMTQSERDAIKNADKPSVIDPKKFAASAKRSESRRKRAAALRKEALAKAVIASACKAHEIPFRPEGCIEAIAYYKTSSRLPRVSQLDYTGPKRVSVPPLAEGSAVAGPAILNAVTARIYDLLASGDPVNASMLISECADLISDSDALHYWLESNGQPTGDDSIRIIPGSFAKTPISKRLSNGRSRCVMTQLRRAVRNGTVQRVTDTDYQITKAALASWAEFREINVTENAA